MAVFENLNASYADVVALVGRYRRLKRENADPNVHYELEGRIGKMQGDQFRASVDRDIMDEAVSLCSSNSAMKTTDWNELQDFFYIHEGSPVRTRVSYDPRHLTLRAETVRKKKLAGVTARAGANGNAVRVTLSEECTVPPEEVPLITETEHVRIQQRRTAQWTRERTAPDWRYDLSVSWSGRTKGDAERAQTSADALSTYELEIELVSDEYLVRKTDEHVAASVLMKLSDFLPASDAFCIRQCAPYATLWD